jgi:cardiolipin synthase A/B
MRLDEHSYEWFTTGRSLLEKKIATIEAARFSVRLEIYIFKDSEIGRRFRQAMTEAAQRGVKVWLLVDAVGSMELDSDYFDELKKLPGVEMKWFNPPSLRTWSLRDHRKLLVVDEEIGFVGGCNIGPSYYGDGVTEGWRDGGMSVCGPVVAELVEEFARQFDRAEKKQWKIQNQLRVTRRKKRRQQKKSAEALPTPTALTTPHEVEQVVDDWPEVTPLFIAPGFGQSPLREAMKHDLAQAKEVAITSAYFLPSWGLQKQLMAAAQRGARVRVLLAGRSDVKMMQLASRSLYRRLIKSGIEIYEYQPQILHAKSLVIDNIVYIGSSNLDPRSLRINFEIMLRVECAALSEKARAQYEIDLTFSQKAEPHLLSGLRGWWTRLTEKVSFWLLARADPRVAENAIRRFSGRV